MGAWEGTLLVNGYEVEARYSSATVEDVVDPILDKLDEMADAKGSRLLVLLAAPPGSGKSTFAAFLEQYYEEEDRDHMLQCVGLDGFHHSNDYLAANGLASLKGSPETFDTEALIAKLDELGSDKRVLWPLYDRTLHEPVQDAIVIEGDIVIVEGNWLLLDEEPWNALVDYADASIMMLAEEDVVRDGLINRKMQGGLSPKEALDYYGSTDGPNVRRALQKSLPADITLRLLAPGEIIFEGENVHARFM